MMTSEWATLKAIQVTKLWELERYENDLETA
jgi:hypothetical protein